MIRFKSTLKLVMVFSALLGLVFVIGCGSSAEKQAMTEFLQMFSDTVSEYAKADDGKKAELEAKINSYESKWYDMKMSIEGEITPQTLDELDKQFKEIKNKYASLNGKS
jgi:hypothetical protein